MLVPGICSVTLRALPPAEVVAVAADAGLCTVEWGGDVHVPPGDLAAAEQVRESTTRAGLTVAAYGSYFRAGVSDPAGIEPVVATAAALGAPRIRVWAGTVGSAAATPADRAAVAESARRLGERAGESGIEVAFEFHGGTLTDAPDSTLALLAAVDLPNVGCYWQPPNSVPDREVLAGLETVLPAVVAVHVFSWWPGTDRHRLVAREPMWLAALDRLGAVDRDLDALLEFVPADDPALVAGEAGILRSWAASRSERASW